jgi:hypothetical protein
MEEGEENPWVIAFCQANKRPNNRTQFAGYSKAYALGAIKKFHEETGEWLRPAELERVLGYSRGCKKVYALLKALADEEYIRLEPGRCQPCEILKFPYYVQRPQGKLRKYTKHRPDLVNAIEAENPFKLPE